MLARRLFLMGFIFTIAVVGWSLWRYSFLRNKTSQEYLEDLSHQKAAIRAMSAYELGRLKIKEAVFPLIQLLDDPSYEVRWNAAVALGNLEDPAAIEPLKRALQDQDTSVQICAVRSLGMFRDPKTTEELISYLNAEHPGLRVAACWAIGQLNDAAWIVKLMPLLSDKDKNVRYVAAIELGKYQKREAKSVLLEMKEKNSGFYREKGTALLENYR